MVGQKHGVQTARGLCQWFMLSACIILHVVDKPGSSDLKVLFGSKQLPIKSVFHWTVVQSHVVSSFIYPPRTYMYTHTCTYIHVHIHVHTFTLTPTHMHTPNMHTCTYMYIHTYMHTCIHTYIHTWTLDPRCCNPTLLNEGRIQPSRPSNVRCSVNLWTRQYTVCMSIASFVSLTVLSLGARDWGYFTAELCYSLQSLPSSSINKSL